MLNLSGQTVAVLGAGRSGQAAAALALHCGAAVTVYDGGDISHVPEGCEAVSRASAETGNEVSADLVVVSPGITTGGDFVQSFAKGSGALWGEVELAWRCYDGKVIGITGTNGKTTTTELVDLFVKAAGHSCAPCGNYGVPLSEIVLRDEVPDVVALELSSFQLETTVDFISIKGSRLRGLHNVENLNAAYAAVTALLDLSAEMAEVALEDYQPPAHRCELIRSVNDVEYVNDSKATNLHALESALHSQAGSTVLLAGGKEKGLDYQPLLPIMQEKVSFAVFFGEIAHSLAEIFKSVIPVEVSETLDEAVCAAQKHAKPGDTVLLSPGTSSFDQFSGYEERGDAFRSAVLALI